MDDKTPLTPSAAPAAAPSAPSAALPAVSKPRRSYETDRKERILLPACLFLGLLVVELFSATLGIGPGAIVPILVAAWYAVLFWYRGGAGLRDLPSRLLFAAVCLLSLTFALYSNSWFHFWNLLLLPCLMAVQFFQWEGGKGKPWYLPSMVPERLRRTLGGLFTNLGAVGESIGSLARKREKEAGKGRQGVGSYVLLGLAAACFLLVLVVPLLLEADALFQHVTDTLFGRMTEFFEVHLSTAVTRVILALCFAPFLFSLLYTLRRGSAKEAKKEGHKPLVLDSAAAVTVLAVMNLLYLFFLAVQVAGLFGGERYLAQVGMSYAEYARSGFFQLVGVAAVNLSLIMACLQLSRAEGKGWTWARVLSSVLVALSCVMLASAAWRMTLYVTTYGLSFKRFLTYWGMVMLAIFFAAALLKIWRKNFSFFRVFFAVGVAGWLVLNFMNVPRLVTRYNVDHYRSAAVMDVPYLAYLSYDTLDILSELPGNMPAWHYGTETVEELLSRRRDHAARTASDWRSWNLSAWLAARGGNSSNFE